MNYIHLGLQTRQGLMRSRVAWVILVSFCLSLVWTAGCASALDPLPTDGPVSGPDLSSTDWQVADRQGTYGPPGPPAENATLLRDEYGVPHIFADSREAAVFAWGYAHAEDRREKILATSYLGEARSAEVFGRDCQKWDVGDCAKLDLALLKFRIPQTVAANYHRLRPETKAVLEAYAAGINHFFEHVQPPSPYFAKPVTAKGIAGAMIYWRTFNAINKSVVSFTGSPYVWRNANLGEGSNQFAVTGQRTAADTTIVSSDPHTPWGSASMLIHVHYADYDLFGSSYSHPLFHVGGNNFVFFGGTALISASAVVVKANLSADKKRYFDHAAKQNGGFVPFKIRSLHVKVAGEPVGASLDVLDTRFGPVNAIQDGHAYALHVFGSADIAYVDYAITSWQVRSFDEYASLFSGPTPTEGNTNRIFGAWNHRIGYIYVASLPMLDDSLDWSQPVSSGDLRLEWAPERWYNLDSQMPELPHVFDPRGDFVQNCNGHPAWATVPPGQIPQNIPKYLRRSPGNGARGDRLVELLVSAKGIDASQAMAIATDIKVPRAGNAIEALRHGIAAAGIDDPAARWGADVGELIEILLAWRDFNGYQATIDSEAMTILYLYDKIASVVWIPPDQTFPIDALDQIAGVLAQVAAAMRQAYSRVFPNPLRVPWGYVHHAVVGGREVPMPGGVHPHLNSLFNNDGELRPDGRVAVRKGSNSMLTASFGPNGFEVYVTNALGQVDESLFPDSPHVGQTIDDFAARRYRRVWLNRQEVEKHLCPFANQPGHEHRARTELTLPEKLRFSSPTE